MPIDPSIVISRPSPPHPSPYSQQIKVACVRMLAAWQEYLPAAEPLPPADDPLGAPYRHRVMVDPFAGTGGGAAIADRLNAAVLYPPTPGASVAAVTTDRWRWYGVEIEAEWGLQSPSSAPTGELRWQDPPRVFIGDSLALTAIFEEGTVDAIVTSPCYGRGSNDYTRRTYRHSLGRPLHPPSSARLHWGDEYRRFHHLAWEQCWEVLKPGGFFLLNISDHIRDGYRQRVTAYHIQELLNRGFEMLQSMPVATARYRNGANRDTRVDFEHVILFVKPT